MDSTQSEGDGPGPGQPQRRERPPVWTREHVTHTERHSGRKWATRTDAYLEVPSNGRRGPQSKDALAVPTAQAQAAVAQGQATVAQGQAAVAQAFPNTSRL